MTEVALIKRRSFITGLAALVAAPAIVRATNIMPVRSMGPARAGFGGTRGLDLRVGDIVQSNGKKMVVTDVYSSDLDLGRWFSNRGIWQRVYTYPEWGFDKFEVVARAPFKKWCGVVYGAEAGAS